MKETKKQPRAKEGIPNQSKENNVEKIFTELLNFFEENNVDIKDQLELRYETAIENWEHEFLNKFYIALVSFLVNRGFIEKKETESGILKISDEEIRKFFPPNAEKLTLKEVLRKICKKASRILLRE